MKRGRVDVAPAPAAIEQDDEVFEDPFIGLNTPAFEGGLQMRTTVGVGESDRPVASQGDDGGTWSDLDVDVDDDDDDDDNEKGGKDDGAARDAVKRVKQTAKGCGKCRCRRRRSRCCFNLAAERNPGR